MQPVNVAQRLDHIRQQIAAACAQAARSADSVQLVAVSKRIALEDVLAACQAGQWIFGENRVDDALARQSALSALLLKANLPAEQLDWHFIGHLQSNKANRTTGKFSLLHGVDSLKLARKIAQQAQSSGGVQPILLEVNIAREPQKHGLLPEETSACIDELKHLPGLHIQGLMCMAPYQAAESELHTVFAGLRNLRDKCATESGIKLPELSMGMSGDFGQAIAEGATIVRVGGAIFGPRL